MRAKYQQGMTTLLITSILLSAALVVTLGSYKNLFFQIKRAQNEVTARQQHWQAEGGLECLFTYVKQDISTIENLIPIGHGQLNQICKDALNLSQLNITDFADGRYQINAKSHNGWTQLSKIFTMHNNSSKGAIQTTSRLTTYGDLQVNPDAKGPPNQAGDYECVSITYKYSYTLQGSPSAKYQTEGIKENSLYAGSPAGNCTQNTTTNVHLTGHASKTKTDNPDDSDYELKDDFVHDDKIDPFESFFGYKKTPENTSKLKESFPEQGRIETTDPTQCKSLIENAFKNVDQVWVTGNCAIHGNLVMTGNAKKYTLVIQDGTFINTGATTFEGAIFHLVDKNKPQFLPENLENYWNSLFTTETGAPTHFTVGKQYTDLQQTVYVDAGAFKATGGYGFDADGLKASIAGSMTLSFDSSKRPTSSLNNIRWQQGSWYAQ
ncbi:hypothetical protein G7083_09470 [Vibrio sp. HDW18]|uniref:hypothetical protein n=1 Tax=Vibrio sp. HDW18 TaxID=2714948 RepID=UPI00140E724D|nr:hypothetical protein [Vibrio sp. HDW18]QIL86052.1 hypothetical protein G7083_09470 [Vibrio sp. HDW18]